MNAEAIYQDLKHKLGDVMPDAELSSRPRWPPRCCASKSSATP